MIFKKNYFKCVITILTNCSIPPQKIHKLIKQRKINGAFLSKKSLT